MNDAPERKEKIACIILAAGKGTRMKSALPKVMHKVAGKPMLMNVIDTTLACNAKKVVVVTSPAMESVREAVKQHYYDMIETVIQPEQLGTGDAARAAEAALQGFSGNIVILCGDTPLIKAETILTLSKLLDSAPYFELAVLGMEVKTVNAYGRLVIDRKGDVERIVEIKDASPKEKDITLCNSGVIIVRSATLFSLLPRLQNNNANGEFYLTDLVKLAREEGGRCGLVVSDNNEVMGVNSRMELAIAESLFQQKIRKDFMDNGVTMINPASVFFSHDTKLGKDVVIHPDVVFGAGVEVGENVEIRSFSHIEGAKINDNAIIGPFARLRPGTEIGDSAHVGNFVELKATKLGAGAKANHLSYIGDAVVGEKANIGAGTITCNYDGFHKYKTEIGQGAFIGSNTSLVAPVKIGDGAIVAAGSVITRDVQADALGIARGRQEEKEAWAKQFRDNKQ